MPAARVRMLRLSLAGLAAWVVGLVLVLVLDLGTLARDIALTGAALGVLACIWAVRADVRAKARAQL
nr:hypothetical protein [Actinomycetales bacterium]